ncbi:MAG: class E sortase [Oscillospiraceae bacterium]
MNIIKQIKKHFFMVVSTILIIVGLLLVGNHFKTTIFAAKPAPPVPIEQPVTPPAPTPAPEPTPKAELYPTNKLFVTSTRHDYKDGDMTLTIPHLKLDRLPVIDGENSAALAKGVGLMQYSQLPNNGNSNVSIVAHRDICGAEFYYINTLTNGDVFYLTYEGKQYEYLYERTQIIEKDDWSPIYCSDNSKLTLLSCDPIGTTIHRIIVVANLQEVNDIIVENFRELREIPVSATADTPEGKVITDEKAA